LTLCGRRLIWLRLLKRLPVSEYENGKDEKEFGSEEKE
jgi:hypothetical protein